jgi:ABC-type sugar transport system substrate-binding protein
MIKWQLEFPPEIQAEREPILAALDRAMDERTVEAVQEAQRLAGEWLARHPEDLVIWDAGEPIAMLADALAWKEAQKDREEMEEWKRHKAESAAH